MFLHAGPAGSRFLRIEHAGRHILKVNCNNYPMTTNSYILPPIFISKLPEEQNPTTLKLEPRVAPPLSEKEQKKFDGISSGQSGEQTEYKVFHLFTKLLEEEQDVPVLVLRDYELDTKRKINLKRKTLISEYPQITNIDMRGQQDCITFLKDLGFVLIEIKRTLTADCLQKAKDQLDRSESFLNDIMPAIRPNSYRLPILKLVIFEFDDPHHPLALDSPDYHYFNCHGDSKDSFKLKWKDLKQKLKSNVPENPLTSLEFKHLARLLTGLWSMKSMNRQTYFDLNDVSLTHLTTQVDVFVDDAHLSSDATKKKIINSPQYAPATNVVYNQPETVFRTAKEIHLMYLTPEQKNVYNNVPHGIIRGAAGTGKTLLILFKIIDLVQSHDNKKIILLAPHPHTLRCKNILEANGVRVILSEEIPPATENLYDVVIIGIHNIHPVLTSPLSVFSNYHSFVDDSQSSFDRIFSTPRLGVELVKSMSGIMAAQNNSYFWWVGDSLQYTSSTFNAQTEEFYKVFFSIMATVPTYTLENVLRNTKEVSNIVLNERDSVKSYYNIRSIDAHASHNITSTLPTLHTLSDGDDNDKFRVDFCVERLEDEFQLLVGTVNPIPLSNIAILWGGSFPYIDELLKRTREMLSTMFNIIPMTIETQLKNSSPTIVFDDVKNAISGEWPVVIFIKQGDICDTSSYVGTSRARTRLIVIDSRRNISDNPHFMHVKWRRENSEFLRVGDNSS